MAISLRSISIPLVNQPRRASQGSCERFGLNKGRKLS
jgi:hypothetical protein